MVSGEYTSITKDGDPTKKRPPKVTRLIVEAALMINLQTPSKPISQQITLIIFSYAIPFSPEVVAKYKLEGEAVFSLRPAWRVQECDGVG